MNRYLRNPVAICIFLLPSAALFLFSVFIPIVWSLVYGFYDWDGVATMTYVGIANFVTMFTKDSTFWDTFVNTSIFVGINTVGQITVGFILAIALLHVVRGRELLKTLYFTPAVISSMALAQLFKRVYSFEPKGLLNSVLHLLGMGQLETAWLSNPKTVLVAVSLVETYKWLGLYMVILYAALVAVPVEILDSAKVDGARGLRLYRSIIIPIISPVLIVTAVMVVNGTLKGFDFPYIMTYGGPGHLSELVATYMYKTSFAKLQFGYGSAISVFLLLESLIAVALIQRLRTIE